jgi:hypothetical protein
MSRRQPTFKQSDVTKALKATVKAGLLIRRVEIAQDGRIIIVPAKVDDVVDGQTREQNEWDGVLR